MSDDTPEELLGVDKKNTDVALGHTHKAAAAVCLLETLTAMPVSPIHFLMILIEGDDLNKYIIHFSKRYS